MLRGQATSISADGQLVVFQSDANDLVPNDTNRASNSATPLTDVFLFNRSTGETSLISFNAAGTGSGDNPSFNPKISPDGRYILFESEAGNLTTESIISGSGHPDLFLRNLQTGTTTLVSKSLSGTTGGNLGSFNASISADGRYVAFDSFASNLTGDDVNPGRDVFVRDLLLGTTVLVSRDLPDAPETTQSSGPRISDNGRVVIFASISETDHRSQIYARDLVANTTELISTDSQEVDRANGGASLGLGRAISADGRFVIFETSSDNLVPQNATFEGTNVYLRDRQLGTTTVVTISANGNTATGGVAGSMTPDGRFVAFVSGEIDLIAGLSDTNGANDVILRDLQTGATRAVSLNATGTATGNRVSGTSQYPFDFSAGAPVLTSDGRYVAFTSEATNLVVDLADNNDGALDQPGEQGGMRRRDIFVRDMQANTTALVSMNRAGSGTGNNGAYTPAMSADGSVIAFESHSSDLVAGQDNSGFLDVFVRNLSAGNTQLASQRSSFLPREELKGGALADVTADGRYVAFLASAPLIADVPIEFGPHLYVRDRVSGQVTVEDVAGGVARDGSPRAAQLSDDGRFIVFGSVASLDSNVPDPNRRGQLYLRNRDTGATQMVTVTTASQASNGVDLGPREFAFSPDGRYVAFSTQSGDLVNGFIDNNGSEFGLGRDIFIRDVVTGTTRLVSHLPGNATSGGNGSSFWPIFSPDGSKLAFASLAADLAAGVSDSNSNIDLFVYDIASTQIEAASVAASGGATGNAASGDAADTQFVFSADGRYVFFGSVASDLVSGDNNTSRDIFRRDLDTNTTTPVSVDSGGTVGNSQSFGLSASHDGNFVAFTSSANNLVAGDTNNRRDAFLRNLATGITTLVSAAPDGSAGNDHSSALEISADGSLVAILSNAANLVPNFVDINGESRDDLFVRRLADGVTALATVSHTGLTGSDTGNFFLSSFEFSENGEHFFFDIDAGNLFSGDRNFVTDVFAYGFAGAGQIRGAVFNDENGSGSRDVGETALAHWTIYIDANGNGQFDPGEINVQTDLAGNYAFTGVAAGTYTVALVVPGRYAQTLPTAPGTYTVTLSDDRAIETGRDFAAAVAQIDIQVANVHAPAMAPIGREFPVNWSVQNNAAQPVIGDWQDAVYLSQDAVLDASDQLLAVVPHTGGLTAGGSYQQTLNVSAPAVAVGNYRVIVQTDRRAQVANDENRANNVLASDIVSLSIPALTLGVPFADQFTGPNQARYYQLMVGAGETMFVTLDSAATEGSTELYLRRGDLPTAWDFDLVNRAIGVADQTLVVPLTQPGTYYVLAQSRAGAAATANFTVTASLPGFTIQNVSSNQGGNSGRVTIEIEGSEFTNQTMVSLVSGSTMIDAADVDFANQALLFATFDLSGRPLGVYDVRATDGNETAVREAAFEILPSVSQIDVQLVVPAFVRFNREGSLLIKYTNLGNTDAVAPILDLAAEGALLRLPEHSVYSGSALSLLGIAPDGPAGVLRPGQEGQVRVKFLATADGDTADFSLGLLSEFDAAVDWESLKEANRPAAVTSEAWNAIWDNVVTASGLTMGAYQNSMAQLATYLSDLGTYTHDLRRLFNFALGEEDSSGRRAASTPRGSPSAMGRPAL